MNLPFLEIGQQRWNRLLILYYWAAFVLSIILELIFLLLVSERPVTEFLTKYILFPSLLMATVILSTEAVIRYAAEKIHDYAVILASAMVAVILTAVHSTLPYLLNLYIFPIVISIFYFQYKKLAFASGVTIASLNLLYAFNPNTQAIGTFGLIYMNTSLLIYVAIAFGVLNRGRDILQRLRAYFETNRELQVRNIMMDKLSKTDALTDTYNHMAYHEFVDKLVEQAEQGRMQLHLAIMDIDNFKKINDTYGHRAGDSVLREIAAVASSKIGPNDFIARYGGEEFVVLFADSDDKTALETMEKIRLAVGLHQHEVLGGWNVTVSIGMSRYVRGMGKEQFFQEADAALYKAKHHGKNRIVAAESMKPFSSK